MPLPDGTPTSSEILDRIYAEHGPIFPQTYDQEAALRRAHGHAAHHRSGVERALASAKAPDIADGRPLTARSTTGELNGDQAIIARLAALEPLQYDRVRKAEAEKLGVRSETLDREVRRARGEPGAEEAAGDAVMFPELEPSAEAIDGAALLEDVAAIIKRFVVVSRHDAAAIVLWIVLTYLIETVDVAPILCATSPEKGCGKTTLIGLLVRLTRRALPSSNISPSALFRSIEKWAPTLLIDEADSFVRESDELRGILNSGHTRASAFVIRNVGEDFEPRRFSTWGAKAIALIGTLPDTLHDRSIVIEMHRKLKHEKVEKLRHADTAEFETLRRRCLRFAADHMDSIRSGRPVVPDELHDRAGDNWEPLLGIADLAGGRWPTIAREAALALSGVQASDSAQLELLSDLRAHFEATETDRIPSESLIGELCADETRRWATYNKGKPISQRQVAALLSRFGIVPNSVRMPDGKNPPRLSPRVVRGRVCPVLTPAGSATAQRAKHGAGLRGIRNRNDRNGVAHRETAGSRAQQGLLRCCAGKAPTRRRGAILMVSAGLLAMLRRRGVTVTAENETLIVRPRELLTDELRAAIRANKPAILAELAEATHYRWRVTLSDGSLFEVCCLPETTAAEMRELYPGTTLEPWPNEECKSLEARNHAHARPTGNDGNVRDRKTCQITPTDAPELRTLTAFCSTSAPLFAHPTGCIFGTPIINAPASHVMARVEGTGYKTGYRIGLADQRTSNGAGFQPQWRFNV